MRSRVITTSARTTMLTAAVAGVLLAAGGARASMVCTPGPTFHLQTSVGHLQTPDANTIYMWSFANAETGAVFQVPSPVLCVTEGDVVSITLTNTLSEPVSIVFPGQSQVTAVGGTPGLFAAEASPGGSVTYTFVASQPGTYLYESGTNQHKQVQMGLYGALVVRPLLGPSFAYNDVETEFNPDREFLLLLHDIDPHLHWAVERGQPFDIGTMDDRYWTINGRAFPDTALDNFDPMLPNQPYGAMVRIQPTDPVMNPLPALVRYANAGLVNHPFHPHGNNMLVIGRDGRRLRSGGVDVSWQSFTTTAGAGQTFEFFAAWHDVEGWDPASNPLPVELPQLPNVVFMGGMTSYSGSPYLGHKGELPPGVTSHNVCGEYNFVWHSHALPEIQNFNEGMGGLTTVWRIEPPGGCSGH